MSSNIIAEGTPMTIGNTSVTAISIAPVAATAAEAAVAATVPVAVAVAVAVAAVLADAVVAAVVPVPPYTVALPADPEETPELTSGVEYCVPESEFPWSS